MKCCAHAQNEMTPLMKAVLGGHTKAVKLILEGGANPNLSGAVSYIIYHNVSGKFGKHLGNFTPT